MLRDPHPVAARRSGRDRNAATALALCERVAARAAARVADFHARAAAAAAEVVQVVRTTSVTACYRAAYDAARANGACEADAEAAGRAALAPTESARTAALHAATRCGLGAVYRAAYDAADRLSQDRVAQAASPANLAALRTAKAAAFAAFRPFERAAAHAAAMVQAARERARIERPLRPKQRPVRLSRRTPRRRSHARRVRLAAVASAGDGAPAPEQPAPLSGPCAQHSSEGEAWAGLPSVRATPIPASRPRLRASSPRTSARRLNTPSGLHAPATTRIPGFRTPSGPARLAAPPARSHDPGRWTACDTSGAAEAPCTSFGAARSMPGSRRNMRMRRRCNRRTASSGRWRSVG